MIRQREGARPPIPNRGSSVSYQSPGAVRSRQQQYPGNVPVKKTAINDVPPAAVSRSCMPGLKLGRRKGSSTGSRSSRSSIKSREQRAMLDTPNWENFDTAENFSTPPPGSTPSTVKETPPFSPFDTSRSGYINTSDETVPHSNIGASAKQPRSSPAEHSPAMSLLTRPAPTDRGIRNRLSYEAQQRRRGVYDGELEPEGVRGQEAVIRTGTDPQATDAPNVRTFGPNSAPRTNSMVLAPTTKSRTRGSTLYGNPSEGDEDDDFAEEGVDQLGQLNSLIDDRRQPRQPDENSHMQFSPETGRAVHFSSSAEDRAPLQETRSRSARQIADEPSTDSDDELKELKNDLIPDLPVVPHQPLNTQRYQRPGLESPQSASRNAPPDIPSSAAAANAMSAVRQTQVPQSNSSLDTLNQQAMQYVKAKDYDRALHVFLKVLNLRKERFGSRHASVASDYHNLGTVHSKRVDLCKGPEQQQCRQQALECFQAAARTARDALGKNHPNVAVSLVRIGFLLLQSQQYQNAIVTFREALRIRFAHFGEQHGLVANLYNNLGVCHMHLGQFPEGQEYLEKAMGVQRRTLETSPTTVHWLELADTLFNLGGLCLEWIRRQGPDTRRANEAEGYFDECLAIRSRHLGQNDDSVRQVKSLLEMARSVPRPPSRTMGQRSASPSRSRPTSPYLERTSASRPTTPSRRPSTPESAPISSSHPMSTSRHLSDSTVSRPFDESFNGGNQQVFRQSPRQKDFPVLGVTVSKDSTEEDPKSSRQTNIFMAPQIIPERSPVRARQMNISTQALVGEYPDESFKVDTSEEAQVVGIQKSFSYDAEENCLISDSGVDSEHGRIHYPVTWTKAGIVADRVGSSSRGARDIMVSRPVRSGAKKVGHHSFDELETKSEFSTGNTERDSVMARARAILSAHERKPLEGQMGLNDDSAESFGIGELTEAVKDDRKAILEEEMMEDGVAPLGGIWPSPSGRPMSINDMVRDPMKNTVAIHAEATKFLKNGNFIEAIRLFNLLLQCQKRRNGPMHADVGAALHNVGIAQLRAQNHEEALKAFEETSRIRKGALGRDHPLVATSLVKAGITLLLLHRFEDALWSFREALSVRKHALGSLHPSTARVYNNIGCVYVEFQEYQEARRAFEAALDIQRNALSQNRDSGPLMYGTATTLCNIGYLYRNRDMYAKASLVLEEACSLQEAVLGQSHATVLSTLDILADSYANSGRAAEALQYYNMVLGRFRDQGRNSSSSSSSSSKLLRAEAILLYKMSRVHRQRGDIESQLETLKSALTAVRMQAQSGASLAQGTDTLERRIQCDVRACREEMEKNDLKWI